VADACNQALRKRKQEDHEFEASLSCLSNSSPAWDRYIARPWLKRRKTKLQNIMRAEALQDEKGETDSWDRCPYPDPLSLGTS
jgi:hypothetical protein